MKYYSVNQLSKLAHVSVRTLHHYDKIGLLKPSARTAAGYRCYSEKELLRLQQILFFKELEFKLEDIISVLDDPEFDLLKALEFQHHALKSKAERLHTLLNTISKTIAVVKDEKVMITPEEMYEGFPKGQGEAYEKEAMEKYGREIVEESKQRVQNMTKGEWNKVKKEQEEFPLLLLPLMDRLPSDTVVQELVAKHHALIEKFYPCNAERYRGLGKLYIEDERFRHNFDKHKAGMAEFLCKAIEYFCDQTLQ